MLGPIFNFKRYYFKIRRDKPFISKSKNINIPIQMIINLVDITDIIKKESQINDVYTAMHIGNQQGSLIEGLHYSLGPEKEGILRSYLHSTKKNTGGKTRMKKTSKSTRKKRTMKKNHPNKTNK